MLNVSEVLTILEKEGLTSSRQVALRWIRQGDLPAVQESRKIGYQIEQSDLDEFIAKKKEAAASTQTTEQTSDDYQAGYQAAIKDLLEKAVVSGSGDLFLFRKNASIPIHLADFKEMAARNFSTGKNNTFYQTAIKNLFHPFGRKTPENVIYVYPLGEPTWLSVKKNCLISWKKWIWKVPVFQMFSRTFIFTIWLQVK